MAEYTQAGLLSALLLFTALTVRDVYLGRSSLHPAGSPGSSPELLPDTGPGYNKVFQEYSRAIGQLYPDIRIEGENHPPTPFNR
ncbi:Selenoprotein T2 [Liparis tanakae]|uniref:Selenoprotein T2 n=1 Tax=Liparis tanakae TaxID=230148 RepID=A0A4Z2ELA2_9TELE|nr:Selenoprotein T2 [Liparis tanakae]